MYVYTHEKEEVWSLDRNSSRHLSAWAKNDECVSPCVGSS